MPIRLEYQPSPPLAGMAAYRAGRGRARERYQKYMLDLQARRQEQTLGFRRQLFLEGKRQEAYGERQALDLADRAAGRKARLDERNVYRQYQTTRDANQLLTDRYDTLKGQLDEILKEGGGHIPNTPEGQRFWANVKKYQEDEEKALATGDWDSIQVRREAIPKLLKLIQTYNRDKHLVRPDDRPGATFPKNGLLYRKPTEPGGEDTIIGWAPDSMLSPEEIAERDALKKKQFDIIDGVRGQWTPGRYGMEFKPLAQGAQPDAGGPDWTWGDYWKMYERMTITKPAEYDAEDKETSPERQVPPKEEDVIKALEKVSGLRNRGGQPGAGAPSDLAPTGEGAAPDAAALGAPTAPAAVAPQPEAEPTVATTPEPEVPPPTAAPVPEAGAERPPALPSAEEMLREIYPETFRETEPKPVQITGRPVTPPKGKAAENMAAKGHEYVPLLNSKGKRTGRNVWRPKPPEQTVTLSNGETMTGRVYRDGDSYTIETPSGETKQLAASQVKSIGSGAEAAETAELGGWATGDFSGGGTERPAEAPQQRPAEMPVKPERERGSTVEPARPEEPTAQQATGSISPATDGQSAMKSFNDPMRVKEDPHHAWIIGKIKTGEQFRAADGQLYSIDATGRMSAVPVWKLPNVASTPPAAAPQPAATREQGPVQVRAIAAARAGDVSAQRALDERGIPWRK